MRQNRGQSPRYAPTGPGSAPVRSSLRTNTITAPETIVAPIVPVLSSAPLSSNRTVPTPTRSRTAPLNAAEMPSSTASSAAMIAIAVSPRATRVSQWRPYS